MVFSDNPNNVSLYTFNTQILQELEVNNNKFKYDSATQRCNLVLRNNTLGMTNENYTFMMALTGLLTSILLVFIIYKKV